MEYSIGTILFAADLSSHAPEVARHAAGLAQKFGAKLHVLHIIEPLSEYAFSVLDSYLPPEAIETLRQQGGLDAARQTMQQRLEQFCRESLVIPPLPAIEIRSSAGSHESAPTMR